MKVGCGGEPPAQGAAPLHPVLSLMATAIAQEFGEVVGGENEGQKTDFSDRVSSIRVNVGWKCDCKIFFS